MINNYKKWIIFSLLLVIFLFSCKTIKPTTTIKYQINKILDEWHSNERNANFNGYFNRFENNSFYIGTQTSEIWTKDEFETFAKPFFDSKNTWDFKTIKRNVFISNNHRVAWFNETLDTWMGICRGSGILELEKKEWKIKQYVLSVTIPNSEMNKVIKLKKEAPSQK